MEPKGGRLLVAALRTVPPLAVALAPHAQRDTAVKDQIYDALTALAARGGRGGVYGGRGGLRCEAPRWGRLPTPAYRPWCRPSRHSMRKMTKGWARGGVWRDIPEVDDVQFGVDAQHSAAWESGARGESQRDLCTMAPPCERSDHDAKPSPIERWATRCVGRRFWS